MERTIKLHTEPVNGHARFEFGQVRLDRRNLILQARVHLPLDPPPHLLEYPLRRIELWTVGRQSDQRQTHATHKLMPVAAIVRVRLREDMPSTLVASHAMRTRNQIVKH